MNYPFAVGAQDVPRLREEHAFSGRQLAEVSRLARAGQAEQCELIWEVFVRDLEQHMQHEEDLFLPAFAKTGVAPDLWASQLRAEHKELRSRCQTISSELAAPAAALTSLHELERQLLEHTERESLVLYPWLATVGSPQQPFWRPHLTVAAPAAALFMFGLCLIAAAGCGNEQQLPPLAQARQADFVNGGFESSDFNGWTVSTHLNPGAGIPMFPPTTISNLGLLTGGVNLSSVQQGTTPESQIPSVLTAADSLRYPRFGKYSAVINEGGKNNSSNTIV